MTNKNDGGVSADTFVVKIQEGRMPIAITPLEKGRNPVAMVPATAPSTSPVPAAPVSQPSTTPATGEKK